jgi:hypothetical protein
VCEPQVCPTGDSGLPYLVTLVFKVPKWVALVGYFNKNYSETYELQGIVVSPASSFDPLAGRP